MQIQRLFGNLKPYQKGRRFTSKSSVLFWNLLFTLPFPGGKRTTIYELYLVDANSYSTISGDTKRKGIATSGFSVECDGAFRTIDLSDDNRLGRSLPARDLLAGFNSHRSGFAVLKILNHQVGISGTDVGNVGSLTALLELVGENGDSDGNEDGRPMMGTAKSVIPFSLKKPDGTRSANLAHP